MYRYRNKLQQSGDQKLAPRSASPRDHHALGGDKIKITTRVELAEIHLSYQVAP